MNNELLSVNLRLAKAVGLFLCWPFMLILAAVVVVVAGLIVWPKIFWESLDA
jgi:hypothetical protein